MSNLSQTSGYKQGAYFSPRLVGGATEHMQTLDRYYVDHHGIVVHVIGYEPDRQRVIYRRPGYEWECASPLIVFRSRFKRTDK
ncbi:DUF4222 domain-containing protein [Pantoea stewartii]|uniref:DUF4222 domain-containing protein n=1 Tax=Pantoea stewartii TaxID=66269 RepID=UPI0030B9324B